MEMSPSNLMETAPVLLVYGVSVPMTTSILLHFVAFDSDLPSSIRRRSLYSIDLTFDQLMLKRRATSF